MPPLIQAKQIGKRFSGVIALDKVDLDVYPGEVHVVIGENGAGKSTLMKILSGVYAPSVGSIQIGKKTYEALSPATSRAEGIGIIYQELSVIDQLSIAENLFLGNLPRKKHSLSIDIKTLRDQSNAILERLRLDRSPQDLVRELSISEKQLVEIGRSLARRLRLLVLDEPTSSLTDQETGTLFGIINNLTKTGVGVIYISHKLDEIKRIAHRVSILRDGHLVGTYRAEQLSVDQMVSLMVGRSLNRHGRVASSRIGGPGPVMFEVKRLTRRDGKIKDISFQLRVGEILGFAGLIGSGRTELVEALFGIVPCDSGEMLLNGQRLRHRNPFQALKNRLALVTENRRETGFFSNFSVQENAALASRLLSSRWGGLWGLVNPAKDAGLAATQQRNLNIRVASLKQNIGELSGGNQQKVLIGKWLAAEPQVMFFDEPTRGIDVGAKAEIYRILRDLSDSGKGIMVISSELPELLYLCDRIIVMRQGCIAGQETCPEATEEKLIRLAMPD